MRKCRRKWDREARPRSYWLQSAEKYLESRPKGTVRRSLLAGAKGAGEDPAWLSQASLSSPERAAWGGIDPAMMGGEYLPDLGPNEVEIARIEMESTTADVISLRAKRTPSGSIRYKMVDEYPEEGTRFSLRPRSTRLPLTFGEIADLLDGAKRDDREPEYESVIWGVLDLNTTMGSGDPREMEGFLRVSSPFYPDLEPYFEWKVRQWIARELRKLRAEEREEEREEE